MEDFSVIPSQFDNIPEGHPVVFISYSWDSDEHRALVRLLSDHLREKYSVYTLLDQYNRGGYDLITFMTKAVERADRVLLIGTPEYKRKSELYDKGGVKYEDQLISIELYHRMGSSKFIPVLRSGKFDTSFRPLIETRTGYNMTNDDNYEETLKLLAADLWNNPMNAAPALGPKPSFAGQGSSTNVESNTKTPVTHEQFDKEIRRLIASPNSDITFTEMIESEAQKAYEQILSKAQYHFSVNAAIFKEYVGFHLSAVERLVSSAITIVRFGTQKQQELLVEAMTKLCMKPFKNGEISQVGTPNLHLFAATFLFHTVGLSCVKYRFYQIIPVMMKKKVPAGHALSPSYAYPLAHLAGMNHWQPDELNVFMEANWLYPYSELVRRNLKPYFQGCFLNDDEYFDGFAAWEHLFSLMYVYYKSGVYTENTVFPTGTFLSERILRYASNTENFYTQFFSAASSEKENWEPIKQGLFDGKYENFVEVYNRAEKYYRGNRRGY